jgi:hypothetical protein
MESRRLSNSKKNLLPNLVRNFFFNVCCVRRVHFFENVFLGGFFGLHVCHVFVTSPTIFAFRQFFPLRTARTLVKRCSHRNAHQAFPRFRLLWVQLSLWIFRGAAVSRFTDDEDLHSQGVGRFEETSTFGQCFWPNLLA